MIFFDKSICKKCGTCISYFDGYCMTQDEGYPIIDYEVCNQCQKCIAICPYQAITMNNIPPTKITDELIKSKIGYDELISLLRFRRSTKIFAKRDIPKDIISKIASSAKYAPNQNKNIDILVIDDPSMIQIIDLCALKFVKRLYKLMFSLKPISKFISIFLKSIYVIKKKMERDLYINKHIVKENTNVLLLVIGNSKVPTTEMSAQYLLATMILTAVSLNVGCTLMDSLKLAINNNKKIKNKLGIKKTNKVLGVLALGYSNEKIVNIPNGYEINLFWNKLND
ncbi:nitroreductase family protein [Caloranaerobacter ferrireducens]|uniref:nitroreductase family protein n=1 Tax=Caloranaerobacter ferrireducens TaxID=1323370 RepID=UPI00084DF046|nr:nitroreductase family protein [Caloranaerobacter ferrireducens]